MSSEAQALRALIARNQPFIAADCYSALTGRVVEAAGFPVAYLGGRATALMHYAMPDCGLLTTSEMVEQAARVVEAIGIPLIVDADQAGESIADVRRTIRRFERVGVAGVHIEDELTPKHSRFDAPLMAVSEMAARITAAVEARTDPAFLVIARCDEFWMDGAAGLPAGGTGSIDEAIRRGVAYTEAGADVFMPILATAEQIDRIAAEVPIPLTGFGKLLEGMSFTISAGWGVMTAGRVHQQLAEALRDTGEVPVEAWPFPMEPVLIDQAGYDDAIASWCRRTGKPVRNAPSDH